MRVRYQMVRGDRMKICRECAHELEIPIKPTTMWEIHEPGKCRVCDRITDEIFRLPNVVPTQLGVPVSGRTVRCGYDSPQPSVIRFMPMIRPTIRAPPTFRRIHFVTVENRAGHRLPWTVPGFLRTCKRKCGNRRLFFP
jgi:hypothetical protein